MGCGEDFDEANRGTSAVLDHDHETNKVRGKLHSNCNIALGLVKDDPMKLVRLAAYLDRSARR